MTGRRMDLSSFKGRGGTRERQGGACGRCCFFFFCALALARGSCSCGSICEVVKLSCSRMYCVNLLGFNPLHYQSRVCIWQAFLLFFLLFFDGFHAANCSCSRRVNCSRWLKIGALERSKAERALCNPSEISQASSRKHSLHRREGCNAGQLSFSGYDELLFGWMQMASRSVDEGRVERE